VDERAKSADCRECQAEQSTEIEALKRLNDASSRLWRTNSLCAGLEETLAATIELLGGDMGNVQILDEVSGKLRIAAQDGFDAEFLEFFQGVAVEDDSACGRALRSCRRVIIEDVEQDPLFASCLHIARNAGFRAVQSTPLVDRHGKPLGMISTHFRRPHRPSELDLQRLDLYVRQASDFIERCRRDEELREKEEFSRTIIESSPDCVKVLDLEGKLLMINESGRRLLGIDDAAPLLGKDWRTAWPWAATRGSGDILADAKTGRTCRFQEFHPTFDGTLKWWDVLVTPVRGSDGEIVRILSVSRDITDRKRAEDALRESEERLRLAAKGAKIGAFDWNIRTGKNVWTSELEAMYGLAPGEFGQTQPAWEELVHPDDRAEAAAKCAEALTTGEPVEHEWRVRWPNGEVHWIAGRFQIFKDANGDPLRLTGINIDITEQKQAEESLRASEERFSKFMQHLPGLAWIKDAQGRYVYVNDAAAKAFNAPSHKLYGMSDDEIFPSATAARFRHNDQCALASPTGVLVEEELEHEDGVLHCSIVSKFPIRDPYGQTLIGGMAIDITERKQAEEALREADRRKDEFLALLAHELRNPLAPIHNGVQILRRSSKGNDCDHDLVIAMMDRQVSQLIRLVDELLEVSRISRGKIELRKERSDMETVLRNAFETSQPLIEKNRHHATLRVPPETLPIQGDPMRLAQVFTNLINNAAKFTPPGGRITIDAFRQAQEAVVEVRDNGFGISLEELPRVFDLFTQSSSPREGGGLGIGLALARGLVEMHGGKIEAKSDGPGKGSVFIVRLPLDRFAPPERARNADSPETTGPGKRVLVIDDDHDVADSLGMLLESLGAKVRVVYDGLSGVEILPAFDPDIVFIDIGMPKVDGYETVRRVRACCDGRKLTLVALTGWGQAEDRAKSLAAGFDAHITKPVSVETLQGLLRRSNSLASFSN